ncbi:MAG: hypothetical protein JO325_23850, partial [Solirubrobacterales bacterium]|nr:hypothetical protein [Solirubrobacterales bacterium]
MALRLTGISTPADGAGAPAGVALAGAPAAATTTATLAQAGAGFGNQLANQARAYLATNDLAAYKALFARAVEHEDPHARYHARVRL